jgi:hypothetical protein
MGSHDARHAIAPACFYQQAADVWIVDESTGNDGPGRTGPANDEIVVGLQLGALQMLIRCTRCACSACSFEGVAGFWVIIVVSFCHFRLNRRR